MRLGLIAVYQNSFWQKWDASHSFPRWSNFISAVHWCFCHKNPFHTTVGSAVFLKTFTLFLTFSFYYAMIHTGKTICLFVETGFCYKVQDTLKLVCSYLVWTHGPFVYLKQKIKILKTNYHWRIKFCLRADGKDKT